MISFIKSIFLPVNMQVIRIAVAVKKGDSVFFGQFLDPFVHPDIITDGRRDAVQDQFDAQTTALVHAMADYGHYVQPVLASNNNWTIGVDYKEMDKFYTSSYDYGAVENAVAGYEIFRDTGDSDVQSITYALNLLTRTQVYLYFTFPDGYAGGFGASVDGSPVVMIKQKTRSYVQTPDYTAHQLDERHDVIVHLPEGGNGQKSKSCKKRPFVVQFHNFAPIEDPMDLSLYVLLLI